MKMKPNDFLKEGKLSKSDGSNTKPYKKVRLMTPAEIAGVKKSKSTAKPTTKAS
jgi:hypothetical protein